MSSNPCKKVGSTSEKDNSPRSRLSSTDVLNVILEKYEFLKSSEPEEATALSEIGFKILRFVHSEDEQEDHSQGWKDEFRRKAERFLLTLESSEIALVKHSVREIFVSLAYELELEEANRRISKLERKVVRRKKNKSRPVYTVQKFLKEAVVGSKKNRGLSFANLLIDNLTLQKIFDEKFTTARFKGKLINEMKLSEKADITNTLYNQCYSNACEREVQWRPTSASCYGVIVNSKNYNTLQKTFLEVIASYMERELTFI